MPFVNMTKTTTNLLGILLTIIGGIFLYMKLCSSCNVSAANEATNEVMAPVVEKGVEAEPVSSATSLASLSISDGDFSCNTDGNYGFNVSSSEILMPVAQSIADCTNGLKTYLDSNPGKVIDVTGYFKSDEQNGSAFPNLGLARSNAVKNYLVANGISSTRINTQGELLDEMVPKNNILGGAIAYGLADRATDADDQLRALRDRINADPLVLYFDHGQASINLTAAQRQKIADISNYLDKVDGAKAKVVGHTDNSGSRTTNMRLGQGRADFAKNYLISNGIASAAIIASSQGPDAPVASNATAAGKAKNRRTVVSLN